MFILPQEFGQSGFWLPGGQLDAGESLRTAVQRECQEEAGVKVVLALSVLFFYLPLELMLLSIFTLLTCFDLKKAIFAESFFPTNERLHSIVLSFLVHPFVSPFFDKLVCRSSYWASLTYK